MPYPAPRANCNTDEFSGGIVEIEGVPKMFQTGNKNWKSIIFKMKGENSIDLKK
jgi:hypothetical protein